MSDEKQQVRARWDLDRCEPSSWMDKELIAALTERYSTSVIPPCRVCGGALEIVSTVGGTVYACSGHDDAEPDAPLRYKAGRAPADEHYSQSRYIDYRRGGDDAVMELIRRFAARLP